MQIHELRAVEPDGAQARCPFVVYGRGVDGRIYWVNREEGRGVLQVGRRRRPGIQHLDKWPKSRDVFEIAYPGFKLPEPTGAQSGAQLPADQS
jgi:hypothetical protein